MNKIILIIVCSIIVLSAAAFGVYNYLKVKAEEGALTLYNAIKEYNPDLNLYTGKVVDFNTTKADSYAIGGNLIKYEGTKPSEGIVFVDVDNTYLAVSNIRINGLYCVYKIDKFDCSIKNDKDTDIVQGQYSTYDIGDSVTLSDNSKWHVIKESNSNSKYVTLLYDTRVDINNDGNILDSGLVTDPDRIPFDKNGKLTYDVYDVNNIGYYIENTYKQQLSSLTDIREVRLLTKKEYSAIINAINFNGLTDQQREAMSIAVTDISGKLLYEHSTGNITQEQNNALNPHWLVNGYTSNWWLNSHTSKSMYTVIWTGFDYGMSKPTTARSLRPVITLSKENIK